MCISFSSGLENISKIQIGKISRKESTRKKVGFGLKSEIYISPIGINFSVLTYKYYLM